ncbi:MAG: YbaB/EbfC family nucleoid-associated protein [Myxococcales bacterium]|nr:YbaB/EbfC family nucleoid-associated protein [Myxococcales bacterium]MCB9521569.1 YbaB/EbfC family nucleoid-associated protein [Myxococcales bacterium]MCB9530565.1 YbaB/EbfC family nucleoid-associated protein [Myxococcales bacterium]MCB9534486.1 YbaB/EbfC family nucleoid-associated protein [Myxococcales bacterium]
MSGQKQGIGGIVKQAQRMQQQITKVQDSLGDVEVEATAGGGVVTAVVNGRQELVKLSIDPTVVDPADVESLQDLVMAAVNLASKNAQAMLQEEVNKITGGLNIPGLF